MLKRIFARFISWVIALVATVAIAVIAAAIAIGLMFLFPNFHATSPEAVRLVENYTVFGLARNVDESWFAGYPRVVVGERLGAYDALINTLFFLSQAFAVVLLFLAIAVAFFIGGLVYAIIGLITGDWEGCLSGPLIAILGPLLMILVAALYPIGFWLGLTLVSWPFTPAYALVWLPLSLVVLVVTYLIGAGLFVGETKLVAVIFVFKQ